MTRSKSKACDWCGAALAYGTRGKLCRACWCENHKPIREYNPGGLCWCGCGQPAPLAKQTNKAIGSRIGEPLRYVRGHFQVRTQERYCIEDHGYEGGPCWIWQRHINDQGYGVVGRRGRAHRLMYEEMVGPIPEGLELDHLCRVRACVNPAHLEPVTGAENVRRGNSPSVVTARALRCQRGHDLSSVEAWYVSPSGHRSCKECRRLSMVAMIERRSAQRRSKRKEAS
jgi:hypothetical protein